MSIRRRWTATCDEPECEACVPLIGDQEDGKWDLGLLIYEQHGWQAAPGIDETYCPLHHHTDFFTEDAHEIEAVPPTSEFSGTAGG